MHYTNGLQSGFLALSTEETDATGLKPVIGPKIYHLALDKQSEELSFHRHCHPVDHVARNRVGQNFPRGGSLLAPDDCIALDSNSGHRPRTKRDQFHGVVVLRVGRAVDPSKSV